MISPKITCSVKFLEPTTIGLGFVPAGGEAHRQRKRQAANFRSIHPNPPSEISAIRAAGMAPARIWTLSTDATPRKIKTPRPPAPMAAAMVAVPTVVTVAMRIPARMVRAASGSSTWRSIWRGSHPHGDRGFAHGRVDAQNPSERVANNRQQVRTAPARRWPSAARCRRSGASESGNRTAPGWGWSAAHWSGRAQAASTPPGASAECRRELQWRWRSTSRLPPAPDART